MRKISFRANCLGFFLSLFIFPYSIHAQRLVIDSLKREINKRNQTNHSPDSTYVNILNDLSLRYQRINPDSSLRLGQLSDSLSKVIHFDKGKAEALRNIGIVYYLRGDYPQALITLFEALKVAEQIKYEKCIGRIYNNIGLIYYGESKYDEALEAQFKSLEIKRRIHDDEGLSTSLNNVANIYKNKGDYEQSIQYHFQSLEVKRELNDVRGIAASLNNIGWVYINQKKFTDAQRYFQEAIPLNIKAKDKIIGSDIAQGLAECLLAFGDYAAALRSAQEGLAIAASINLRDQLRDCNETISKIYKAQAKYKEAYHHYEKFKLYADSINNIEVERKTSMIASRYEYEKRENEMKAEQEKRNNEFETQKLQQWWIIFSTLAGLASVSLFAIFIFRSRRKIEHAYHRLELAIEDSQAKSEALHVSNAELQHQKEEIAAQRDIVAEQNLKLQQASKIIEDQNEEIKIRIENLEIEVEKRTQELLEYNQQLEQFAFITAHNLRSPVATILGLGNLLEITPDQQKEKEAIFNRLIFTTRELDRVVRDLNTILEIRKNDNSSISEIDLEEELKVLLVSLDKEISSTQAHVEWNFSQVATVRAVKPYLYSILFNLITNAIKYRHAERNPSIKISSQLREGFVCIVVVDNGIGIDLKKFKEKIFTLYSRFHNHVEGKGLGLHLVKTQLSAMRGTIEIESEVDQGTTFYVYLPN